MLCLDWDCCERAQPRLCCIIPGQVGLGCVRKQAEHEPVHKPVRRVPLWCLLQLLPWLPTTTPSGIDCPGKHRSNKPFPPQVFFEYGISHSNRKQTRTRFIFLISCDMLRISFIKVMNVWFLWYPRFYHGCLSMFLFCIKVSNYPLSNQHIEASEVIKTFQFILSLLFINL